jgi:peptidoglycan hydrolase-like protein with peptidoglycan-binding domain
VVQQRGVFIMKHRRFAGFSRFVLAGAFAVAGLSASLLALPANGGPLATALDTTVAEAAPQEPDGELIECLPTLSRGDRGKSVRLLQSALNSRGGSSLPYLTIDGVFGDQTYRRVREFQSDKGLKADGVVGPQTWRALQVPYC